jgi:hypothetical protein
MIIIDIEQGSEQWFVEKAGKPGSSSFDRIITTKGEPSKQRSDYLLQLAGERIIGRQEEGYCSPAMARGTQMEAEARALYEMVHGCEVRQVGLIYRDEKKRVLCSPDGLPDNGVRGLEIKNPLLKTHTKYLLGGKLPTDYFQQVHGSMWVCECDKWAFLSYYPCMPQLDIVVERDDKFFDRLEVLMKEFLDELDHVTERLNALR